MGAIGAMGGNGFIGIVGSIIGLGAGSGLGA